MRFDEAAFASNLQHDREPNPPRTLPQDAAWLDDASFKIIQGAAEERLTDIPPGTVNSTITSPPYFRQKDYQHVSQLGWERTVGDYIERMRVILELMYLATADTGACFIVIGDTYVKKSLQLVPQRMAIAAQECGWVVRNDLVWEKLDAPPDNAQDRWRFTHEHILFLTKRPSRYRFNVDAIRVPYSKSTLGRWGSGQAYGGSKATGESGPRGQRFARGRTFQLNPHGTIARDVLRHATARSPLAHFATYPVSLVEPLVLATTAPRDIVLDPFAGTGTTGVAALANSRRFLGIELNKKHALLASRRLAQMKSPRLT